MLSYIGIYWQVAKSLSKKIHSINLAYLSKMILQLHNSFTFLWISDISMDHPTCTIFFQLPGRANTARHKQFRFLGCTDDNFLAQVKNKPKRGHCSHTSIKEELVAVVKTEDSLGCSEHGMMTFRILRGGSKAQKLNHKIWPQENILWSVQGSARKNPMGAGPWKKKK